MGKYIFRNTAIEYLFDESYTFSGYNDTSFEDKYDEYYFCYFIDYTNYKEDIINCIANAKFNIEYIVKNISNKRIYVMTLYNYFASSMIGSSNEIEESINDFNKYIYSLGENVYIIDIKHFYLSLTNVFDLRFYYNYNAIISPKFKDEFKKWFNDEYNRINKVRKKCLIIDFDNTIWHGILGEDGVNGIGFKGDYPNNIYGEIQKIIKQVKDTGVILCGVTKNNASDIDEVFEKRTDLVLKKNDFSIIKSGWDNKVDYITEIIKELNIGCDSAVFVDDSSFEIDLVKKNLNIETILLPTEKYNIPRFLTEKFTEYFYIYKLSNEDLNKRLLYENMKLAEDMKLSVSDYASYLKELNMKLEIEYMDKYNIDRIIQLINKSNQFNLTTRRYIKEEFENSISDKDFVYCVSVRDKFGDLGICGVCVIKESKQGYFIDEFLLSCRVLGRTIENEFLKVVLNDLNEKSIDEINAIYIKTSKNIQVENFYDDFGFTITEKNLEYKKYKLKIIKQDINKDMEVKLNKKYIRK